MNIIAFVPGMLAASGSLRRTRRASAAYWPWAIGHLSALAALIPLRWMVDLGSDAQAAIGLVVIPRYAGIVSAGAVFFAFLLSKAGVIPDFWRRGRDDPWLCADCEYDLTGVRGDRCPECGRLLKPRTSGSDKCE